MLALLLVLAAQTPAAAPPPADWPASVQPHKDPRLLRAVTQAIRDEIGHGISATKAKNMDQYMEQVPDDYRIVEDVGTISDKALLRAKQEQAWAIITRTNALTIDVTKVTLGWGGECATVWTDQRWDRQMLGKDGTSEHVVVTTQQHIEQWKLAGSRWVNSKIVELGGAVTVDGERW
jgi:hypothetical protein